MADIAVVEVAMRNAMAAKLAQQWGDRWYADGPMLDKRTGKLLEEAWERIPKAQKENLKTNRAVTGRLIANLMFGFWANLLDAGGSSGLPAPRDYADHSVLWEPALKKAFKGARAEARKAKAGFDRQWVHAQVKEVNDLRNRVAHHESLVNGYPLAGQNGVRRTAAQGHEACLRLARMIDRDLAQWLLATSGVPTLLKLKPSIDEPDPAPPCSTAPKVVAEQA